MGDEAPVIYGLEFQARALSAQCPGGDSEAIRFLVGTQSLKFDNQVHQLEYEEEGGGLLKSVFLHPGGEIWDISASPKDPGLLATCYNQVTPDGKCEMRAALWRLPPASTASDDTSSSYPSLEPVADLSDVRDAVGEELRSVVWEPVSGDRVVTLAESSVHLWDLADPSKPESRLLSDQQKVRQKFAAAAWNPHHNCTVVAAAVDAHVRSWDLRTGRPAWSVENAHGQLVRSLDFNPNKQYHLATCGDDCRTKFWDARNPSEPLLVLSDHSHWVWCVRYNSFHDQLVLTSSSDSRVVLSRAASVSSEPFGYLFDEEDAANNGPDEPARAKVSDGVVSTYEEHEDSVYAVEWSTVDPWLFASLSYDGRLVINKVPRAEKYRILL